MALGALAGALLYRQVRRGPEDLAGRVVLITGGSRGLGLALARELAHHGCRLALAARDEARLAQVRDDPRFLSADVAIFPCDLRDEEQIKKLIGDVVSRFGRIDILINNAGIIQVGPAQDMKVEDFREAFDVMFWAPLHATLESLPHFRRQGGGRIVNIASIGGKVSVPHLLPYGCAKFALVGLSEGLHAELARENIHVMTVAPGLMRTGSHLNAEFRGRQNNELTWFGLSGNTPGLSLPAAEAAAQIVEGLRHRKTELILSTPARWLSRAHGVAPAPVVGALRIANQFLPGPAGEATGKLSGRTVMQRNDGLGVRAVARAGRDAAARYQ